MKILRNPLLISLFLCICTVFFIFIRLSNTLVWWTEFQSDHAIVGLMAKHITEGSFPVYFYGQNYMGSLISLTAALIANIMHCFSYVESLAGTQLTVGPQAIGFATLFWAGLGLPVWFFAIRKKISLPAAYLFTTILMVSTSHLFKASTLTNGSISIFTICGLLWLSTPNSIIWKNSEKFLFAAILGFGWWTNQNIVFFALPIIFYNLKDNGFFQTVTWRQLIAFRKKLIPIYFLLLPIFCFGLFIALRGGAFEERWFGIRVRIPSGTSTIRDSILILAVFQLLFYAVDFFKSQHTKKTALQQLKNLTPFLLGFLLGYFPVWVGKLLNWYPKNYGLKTNIMPIEHWWSHLIKTFSETLPGAVASSSFLLFFLGLIFIFKASISYKQYKFYKEVRLLITILLFNIFITLISERALGVNFRYLFASFYVFWIIACVGILSIKIKFVPLLLNTIIIIVLFIKVLPIIEAAKLEAGKNYTRKHEIENIVLQLKQNQHKYCWGDFWTAYLLTYFSNETVLVSPNQYSQDNQVRVPENHKLVASASPKCYVFRKGKTATANLLYTKNNPWKTD